MDSLNLDRPETRLQFGEERPPASAETWWQLGTGAALLLVVGGGVSVRKLARAAAVAGGAALVYRALTGPEGLLARLETRSGIEDDMVQDNRTSALSGATGSTVSSLPTSSAALDIDRPQEEAEPALAGSDGIPPIDLRGA